MKGFDVTASLSRAADGPWHLNSQNFPIQYQDETVENRKCTIDSACGEGLDTTTENQREGVGTGDIRMAVPADPAKPNSLVTSQHSVGFGIPSVGGVPAK